MLPDKPFHILQIIGHGHLRQRLQHRRMIPLPSGRTIIQHSDYAGIRLRPDGTTKALTELDLHLRQDYGIDELLKARILPLLLFLQLDRKSVV